MSLKMAEERPSLIRKTAMNILRFPWIPKGLLLIAIMLLLFSCYKITAYYAASSDNKKTYADVRKIYYQDISQSVEVTVNQQPLIQPTETAHLVNYPPEKKLNHKFIDLIKQNSDIVGWIKIASTPIDYPVTQASDNTFYLENDVNKEKNPAGSIFMDYRNLSDGYNRNTILYGHEMGTGAMFAKLLDYQSKTNFDNKSVIEFDTLYADEKWQIFSAYTTDSHFDYIKTDFRSDEEYLMFLKTIQAKSIHSSTIVLTETDIILTLSTCSAAASDARFVVHAKLIKHS